MKVLFATAGGHSDEPARRYVGGAPWPQGSEIEVIGVVEPAGLDLSGALLERNLRDFEGELRYIAQGLPLDGSTVTWRCVVGQPAMAITQRARQLNADLIVVGTRGRGRIAAAVLGSVSAGVVDRAPCPVLVARAATCDRIVLADDGSVGAAAAAALVQEWPVFGSSTVHVVSVVDMGRPLSADDPGHHFGDDTLHVELLNEERDRARLALAERGHALAGRDRPVLTRVREGDAASEILAAADEYAADLIVVGSRGYTGLARFFAGSVARHVLLDATCSVLIARGWAALSGDRGPSLLRRGLALV